MSVYCTWSHGETLDEGERYTAGSCLLPLCCESERGETIHSRPSIYAERIEKGRIGEGRDKRYGGTEGGTDRHTDVDVC